MSELTAWLFLAFGCIGWALFVKERRSRMAWEKERAELKMETIALHKLHRENELEIDKLRREINAIQSERERFNERMSKVDRLFDSLGYQKDETND